MPENLTIHAIFETKEAQYTKNALLYQDILQYSIDTGITEFQFYEHLGKWLLVKNVEFREEYSGSRKHIPPRTRFANKRQRIQDKINDLIRVSLIQINGSTKASKVNTDIPLYSLTNEGKFFALMLGRDLAEDRNKINQILYDFIMPWLQSYDSSITTFATAIYERYYKEDSIDIPFDIIRDHILDKFNYILDRLLVPVSEVPKEKYQERHWRIVYETLMTLEPHIRKKVLFHFKHNAEHKIMRAYPDSVWEQDWIKNIDNENIFVLWGKCNKCKQSYTFSLPSEKIFEDILLKNKVPTDDCDECGGKGTIDIGSRK